MMQKITDAPGVGGSEDVCEETAGHIQEMSAVFFVYLFFISYSTLYFIKYTL